MDRLFSALERIFSSNVFGDFQLYDLLATIFKYIFVIIVYYFIYNIIKMIFLDIKGARSMGYEYTTYLKLINRKEQLQFNVQENYAIGNRATIGRDDSNTIVIKDRFMSKRHVQIIKDENLYFLEDLNSANGTFLNGKEINDAIQLKDKDIINIGQVEFLFVDGEHDNEK